MSNYGDSQSSGKECAPAQPTGIIFFLARRDNMSDAQVSKWRADTPGCANVRHFNNAGAALMTHRVRDAVVVHMDLELGIGGYEAAAKESTAVNRDVYAAVAELINAESPDEIAITDSATAAWIAAFYSIPFQANDVILTSTVEYAANYVALLQVQKRFAIKIELLPEDESGAVKVEALATRLRLDSKQEVPQVKLVTITHIPTNGGLVNPVEEIGEVLKDFPKVLYIVDACQTAGQKPIDVQKMHCHFLSATSRKYLRGPRGMGFLYARKDMLDVVEPATIDHFAAKWVEEDRYELRPDARRFERWESSIANKLGLLAAVRYALDDVGIEKGWERITMLADRLRTGLGRVAGVHVTDRGSVKCGIVTFTVDGSTPEALVGSLRSMGFNLSVSTAASTLVDMSRRELPAVARASVHYYNTEDEVDALVDAVTQIRDGTK